MTNSRNVHYGTFPRMRLDGILWVTYQFTPDGEADAPDEWSSSCADTDWVRPSPELIGSSAMQTWREVAAAGFNRLNAISA